MFFSNSPDDEDIWFEALAGEPQAAAMLGLGGGGAPHPELAPPGPVAGGGPQPVDPLVNSPPPERPRTALRLPHPVPRSLKERPSSLFEEIPVSSGMSEEREEDEEGAPLEEQLFALGSCNLK